MKWLFAPWRCATAHYEFCVDLNHGPITIWNSAPQIITTAVWECCQCTNIFGVKQKTCLCLWITSKCTNTCSLTSTRLSRVCDNNIFYYRFPLSSLTTSLPSFSVLLHPSLLPSLHPYFPSFLSPPSVPTSLPPSRPPSLLPSLPTSLTTSKRPSFHCYIFKCNPIYPYLTYAKFIADVLNCTTLLMGHSSVT